MHGCHPHPELRFVLRSPLQSSLGLWPLKVILILPEKQEPHQTRRPQKLSLDLTLVPSKQYLKLASKLYIGRRKGQNMNQSDCKLLQDVIGSICEERQELWRNQRRNIYWNSCNSNPPFLNGGPNSPPEYSPLDSQQQK